MSIQTEINRITQLRDEQTSLLNSQTVTIDDIKLALVNKTAGGGSVAEDLSSELNTYESYLTTQETTIEDILSALEGKAAGGGSNANEIMAGFFNDTIEELDNEYITYTHSYCICNKTKLKKIRLSGLTTLSGYAVSSCTAVHTIEFEILTKMNGTSFNGLTALEKLIIRTPSVCTLANANTLSRTKIESGTGYIYVPDDLVDDYKAASNWSTYASQIKGLSELEG